MVDWGAHLPWVYVHSIYVHLFGVVVLHRFMVDWRRGLGQSAMGICAFSLYVKLI